MFKGKKTYIVAVAGVVMAVAGYFHGDFSAVEAGQTAMTAIIGATLRHAI
jgi:SOS-response transcriptional repressor LexA